PTVLHLIRHGQADHNLHEDYDLPDTSLTPEGEQQSLALAYKIPNISSITCIYASPMRRTLQTALLTFRGVLHLRPDLRIIALPELQETSDFACDTGSSLAQLRLEFKSEPVDLSRLFEGWNDKKEGRFRPTTDLTEQRAGEARKIIRDEAEGTVAIVAHGGVNHYFTEDWEGSSSGSGTGWKNCEYRTYKF
ncbi:phosphoglycerate mutase, partial [Aaosphaeria arxii CBS 175.79]